MSDRPLVFPNADALRVALLAGMVPADTQRLPVRYWTTGAGEVGVWPAAPLPTPALADLAAAGVRFEDAPDDTKTAPCWAAMLPPLRQTDEDLAPRDVLFLMDGERSFLDLAGELLRLGCDRQSYRILANGSGMQAMLRAADPPYFTVASAIDVPGQYHAYVPARPGEDRVWTELGYTHPLAETIEAPDDQVLTIDAAGRWRAYPLGPWTDVYRLIDVTLPGEALALRGVEAPRRLTVPLRLSRTTRNEAPTLWVIRHDAVNVVDRMVQTLPDDIISRLRFAVTGSAEEPVVILRVRPGRNEPPQIDVPAETYVRMLQISNLYVPLDSIIEPPLRRDKLRELLAPAAEEIAWLAPQGEDGFRVERIAEDAFARLPDWVDYLVDRHEDALQPWVHSTTFDTEPFVSVGVEWAETPKTKKKDDKPDEPRIRRRREDREPDLPLRGRGDGDDAGQRRVVIDPFEGIERREPTELERRLGEIEQQFLAMEEPVDDPARTPMWAQMAGLNAALNRPNDSALCWTRALWEAPANTAGPLAAAWADSAGVPSSEDAAAPLTEILARREPDRDAVRTIVAHLVASLAQQSAPQWDRSTQDIVAWLDRYDDVLDVRSLWLGRLAIAQLTGGDRLGAARARDRILRRLATGLSLERDVPSFLRFLGGGAAQQGSSLEELVAGLEALYQRYVKTPRRRHVAEAPEELTNAYVSFVFAYGFARLANPERAHALRDAAVRALDTSDPIHDFLVRAYSARIDQALEGRPLEAPLPPDIAGRLNALEAYPRYRVDVLREASTILEAQERLDPTTGFLQEGRDPRGAEFQALRGMEDTEALAGEIGRLVELAVGAEPAERARLFDGVMDFFPLLPSQAVSHLQHVLSHMDDIAPAQRAILMEEALMLAGYFGRGDIVQPVADRLRLLVSQLTPEDATAAAAGFGASLRGLRRVGLRETAAELLETFTRVVTGEDTPALVARLQIASGLAYLGDVERAATILQEANAALAAMATDHTAVAARIRITRAAATALSQMPREYALTGLAHLSEQLPYITDFNHGGTHLCTSVVVFIEALVLGYASDDLALGELGRRWLDEDEFLVRRRIHRDLGDLS